MKETAKSEQIKEERSIDSLSLKKLQKYGGKILKQQSDFYDALCEGERTSLVLLSSKHNSRFVSEKTRKIRSDLALHLVLKALTVASQIHVTICETILRNTHPRKKNANHSPERFIPNEEEFELENLAVWEPFKQALEQDERNHQKGVFRRLQKIKIYLVSDFESELNFLQSMNFLSQLIEYLKGFKLYSLKELGVIVETPKFQTCQISHYFHKINQHICDILKQSTISAFHCCPDTFRYACQESEHDRKQIMEEILGKSVEDDVEINHRKEEILDKFTSVKELYLKNSVRINENSEFTTLSHKIFNHFSNIIRLFIRMKNPDSEKFLKFTELCNCLGSKFPMLQFLDIVDLEASIDMTGGLSVILRDCPYLFGLRIAKPMFNEVERQLLQKIVSKSFYMQKILDMVKMLQKKGYDTDTIHGIIRRTEPLNILGRGP